MATSPSVNHPASVAAMTGAVSLAATPSRPLAPAPGPAQPAPYYLTILRNIRQINDDLARCRAEFESDPARTHLLAHTRLPGIRRDLEATQKLIDDVRDHDPFDASRLRLLNLSHRRLEILINCSMRSRNYMVQGSRNLSTGHSSSLRFGMAGAALATLFTIRPEALYAADSSRCIDDIFLQGECAGLNNIGEAAATDSALQGVERHFPSLARAAPSCDLEIAEDAQSSFRNELQRISASNGGSYPVGAIFSLSRKDRVTSQPSGRPAIALIRDEIFSLAFLSPHKIVFFDPHGSTAANSPNAYALEFPSIDAAAQFLAERMPYDDNLSLDQLRTREAFRSEAYNHLRDQWERTQPGYGIVTYRAAPDDLQNSWSREAREIAHKRIYECIGVNPNLVGVCYLKPNTAPTPATPGDLAFHMATAAATAATATATLVPRPTLAPSLALASAAGSTLSAATLQPRPTAASTAATAAAAASSLSTSGRPVSVILTSLLNEMEVPERFPRYPKRQVIESLLNELETTAPEVAADLYRQITRKDDFYNYYDSRNVNKCRMAIMDALARIRNNPASAATAGAMVTASASTATATATLAPRPPSALPLALTSAAGSTLSATTASAASIAMASGATTHDAVSVSHTPLAPSASVVAHSPAPAPAERVMRISTRRMWRNLVNDYVRHSDLRNVRTEVEQLHRSHGDMRPRHADRLAEIWQSNVAGFAAAQHTHGAAFDAPPAREGHEDHVMPGAPGGPDIHGATGGGPIRAPSPPVAAAAAAAGNAAATAPGRRPLVPGPVRAPSPLAAAARAPDPFEIGKLYDEISKLLISEDLRNPDSGIYELLLAQVDNLKRLAPEDARELFADPAVGSEANFVNRANAGDEGSSHPALLRAYDRVIERMRR